MITVRHLGVWIVGGVFCLPIAVWAGGFLGPHGSSSSTTPQAIVSVTTSPASPSFISGAPDGTQVAPISTLMSPPLPVFSGTYSVGGTNASAFRISGSNLVTNGVQSSASYSITLTATPTLTTPPIAPFTTAPITITTPGQTVADINLSATSFTAGAPSGTTVAAITAAMTPASPAFSGSFSVQVVQGPAGSFAVSGSNLQTVGVLCSSSPPCTYNILVTATPSANIQPFSKNFTITAIAPAGTVTVYLTNPGSLSTWPVPSDWPSGNNSIELIGGGAGGGTSNSGTDAGGGGAGGYSKITNLALTPGANISYQVGAGGAAATGGGDTWFNGATFAASSVGAKGGVSTTGTIGGAGGASSSGIGTVKFSGGSGGTSTNAFNGGAAGGGAAGSNGDGKNGSNSSAHAGSGGGGAGGGLSTNGSDGGGTTGGQGGAAQDGTVGGAGGISLTSNAVPGLRGSGGGGGASGGTGSQDTGAIGGAGIEFDATHGAGGGGGGGGYAGGNGGAGGSYGGGGGGSAFAAPSGGAGAQGIIKITYGGTAPIQSIVSVGMNPTSFVGGSPDGTQVGATSVVMSPASPAFAGTISTGGINATSFRISGANVVTNGVVPQGNYSITLTATPSNGSISPFTTGPIAIVGTPPASQTIASINLDNAQFTAGSGSAGQLIGHVSVMMSPTAPAFSGTITQSNSNLVLNNCTASTCDLRVGAADLAPAVYSGNFTATPSNGAIAPKTQAFSVTGSGPAGAVVTTYTIQNNSASILPAGSPYLAGQAFRRGDFPPGTYPVFRDSTTHAPLVQQLDEIATRRENGDDNSIRHLSFSIQIPVAVPAFGTYTMEIVKQTGTYATPAGKQTLAGLCAAHDLKLDLTDVRNQSGTVRDSGHAVSRVCDNISNVGRDAPRRVAQGPVRDSWIVRGAPIYVTSGNKDPLIYVEWTLDLTTSASDQTSLGSVRHIASVMNPWMRVAAGSAGNAGAPGPVGFANDPQGISYHPETLDGSTSLINWSWYDADVDSATSPVITGGSTPTCQSGPGTTGNLVIPSSLGNNAWFKGMAVFYHTSGTPPSGMTNDKLYFIDATSGNFRTSDANNSKQIHLLQAPDCTGAAPPISPTTQGSGIQQFRYRIWHPKWASWFTAAQDGKESWTSGTSRVVSSLYPSFSSAEKRHWYATGTFLPFKDDPFVNGNDPDLGIDFGTFGTRNYQPFGVGPMLGGGSTGGEHAYLGTQSDYVMLAMTTQTAVSWDKVRVGARVAPHQAYSNIRDEVTGRLIIMNNGPPAANHGGSGTPYTEGSLTLPLRPAAIDLVGFGGITGNTPLITTALENSPISGYTLYHIPSAGNVGGDHIASTQNGWYQVSGARADLDLIYTNSNFALSRVPSWDVEVSHQTSTVAGVDYYGLFNSCCQVRGAYWVARDTGMCAAYGADANVERQYCNDRLTENYWQWIALTNFINGGATGNFSSLFTTPYFEINPSTFKNSYGHVTMGQLWAVLRDPLSGYFIPRFTQEHLTRCSDTVPNSYSSFYCGTFNWIANVVDASHLKDGGALFEGYAPNTGQYFADNAASNGEAQYYFHVNDSLNPAPDTLVYDVSEGVYASNGDKIKNPQSNVPEGVVGTVPDQLSDRSFWYTLSNVVKGPSGRMISAKVINPATGTPFTAFTFGGVASPNIFYMALRPTDPSDSLPTGSFSAYSNYAVASIKLLMTVGQRTQLQPAHDKMVNVRGMGFNPDFIFYKLYFDETVVVP